MSAKDLNRLILMWIAVTLGIYLFFRLTSVFTPFLVAFGVAYLANPMVNRLEKWMGSRTVAVSAVFGVLLIGLTILLLIIIPVLINQLIAFIHDFPKYYGWIQSNIYPLLDRFFEIDYVRDNESAIREAFTKSLSSLSDLPAKVMSYITASTGAIIRFLVSLFLVPMIIFYIMRDWPILAERFEAILPRKYAPKVLRFLNESDAMLSSFLRGQFSVMLILAFVYSVGLTIAGVKYGVVIGVIAGLVSFIPYLGASSGIALGLIVAWFQFGDFSHLIYVSIVFGIGQALESFLLTPVLIGDKLGMHPIAVIFALMAGGSLFGFFGILLALPACAVLMVALRDLYRRYQASQFYQFRYEAVKEEGDA